MRLKWMFLALLVMSAGGLLNAQADSTAQFAGCATDAELPYASRIILPDLHNTKFSITVIGLDGFDPQVMIKSEDGLLVGCNNNSEEKAGAGVNLPTAQIGFSDQTAYVPVRYLADENPDSTPMDYEVIVTGANGQSGQFVLIYRGDYIENGDDFDQIIVYTTPEQVSAGYPLAIYVTNPERENWTLRPELIFAANTPEAVTCTTSSSTQQCGPNTVPLGGFSVNTAADELFTFLDSDVMINQRTYTGGRPYIVEIRAQGRLSYGPYLWILQSGVAYPPDFQGRG
jgi:hypothetical protein